MKVWRVIRYSQVTNSVPKTRIRQGKWILQQRGKVGIKMTVVMRIAKKKKINLGTNKISLLDLHLMQQKF